MSETGHIHEHQFQPGVPSPPPEAVATAPPPEAPPQADEPAAESKPTKEPARKAGSVVKEENA